ncbi:hypothetical protein KSP39_PZI010199 [Platanthera zijinensis]|uniref:Uncharacterized protein n=1 Tax=Platanthera zijinensis TaxID=2320716 RepID=A0AAP0BKH8_9ASPA
MTTAVSQHIHNSPAMAMSIRSPVRPLINPNWRSPAHPVRLQLSPTLPSLNFPRPPRLSAYRRAFHESKRLLTCALRNDGAEPGPKDTAADEELQARGESSMPERFRYLSKEVPDRPVRWPWFIAPFFLLYAWRTVFWELSNWKKAALTILGAIGWLLKLALAFVFRFIGTPITRLIRCVEFALHTIRYAYGNIIAFTPVSELTHIILFTTTILSIAEAAVPDSVNSQQYLLTLTGIVAFGTVRGFVPELPFWVILSGMFFYSKFIEKRDSVSAFLPSAALLAAIGEPWVRCVVITSYLALSITHYAKHSNDDARKAILRNNKRLPLPLLLASLAIGINFSAKWIRHRHLTWMVV